MRATIYFAVGVTSESGNKAYMLAVAGDRTSTPLLEPADNSGYSIGTIQTDLGQHYQPSNPRGENVPRDLVNAYQDWARLDQPTWVLNDEDFSQTVSDLGRNGRQIRNEGGRALDATVKSHLDTFLASEQGITWCTTAMWRRSTRSWRRRCRRFNKAMSIGMPRWTIRSD